MERVLFAAFSKLIPGILFRRYIAKRVRDYLFEDQLFIEFLYYWKRDPDQIDKMKNCLLDIKTIEWERGCSCINRYANFHIHVIINNSRMFSKQRKKERETIIKRLKELSL